MSAPMIRNVLKNTFRNVHQNLIKTYPVGIISSCNLSSSVNNEAQEYDSLFKHILVEVKGHDKEVLNSYEKYVKMTANELEINIGKIWSPPRIIDRHTVLKSVHIFKKHRVQYEMRTNYRSFRFDRLTGSTADAFLEYIQRNLPEGIAMKVTKTELLDIPEHIRSEIKENTL